MAPLPKDEVVNAISQSEIGIVGAINRILTIHLQDNTMSQTTNRKLGSNASKDISAYSKALGYTVTIRDGEANLTRDGISADFTRINSIKQDSSAKLLISKIEACKSSAELIDVLKASTTISDWSLPVTKQRESVEYNYSDVEATLKSAKLFQTFKKLAHQAASNEVIVATYDGGDVPVSVSLMKAAEYRAKARADATWEDNNVVIVGKLTTGRSLKEIVSEHCSHK